MTEKFFKKQDDDSEETTNGGLKVVFPSKSQVDNRNQDVTVSLPQLTPLEAVRLKRSRTTQEGVKIINRSSKVENARSLGSTVSIDFTNGRYCVVSVTEFKRLVQEWVDHEHKRLDLGRPLEDGLPLASEAKQLFHEVKEKKRLESFEEFRKHLFYGIKESIKEAKNSAITIPINDYKDVLPEIRDYLDEVRKMGYEAKEIVDHGDPKKPITHIEVSY